MLQVSGSCAHIWDPNSVDILCALQIVTRSLYLYLYAKTLNGSIFSTYTIQQLSPPRTEILMSYIVLRTLFCAIYKSVGKVNHCFV